MALDQVIARHKLLLITIKDEFDTDSSEYASFIEHFKGYVPRGKLAAKKELLDKFDALASRGHLRPGKYDVLKTISEDSGNRNITILIEEAEEDISKLRKSSDSIGQQGSSTGPPRSRPTVQDVTNDEPSSKRARTGHIESSFEDEEACKIHDLRSLQTCFKAEDESVIYKPRHIESSFKDEDADKIPDFRSLQTSFKAEDATEIYKPRDDDEELDPFLCSGKVKNIKTLIESGRLPRQRILDEMCQIFGRKSQEITITCEAICEQIKSKHAAIAYVWAAYTIQNPHKITFVVIVKHKSEGDTSTEPLDLDKLITYSFVNQYVGEFSSEGPEVLRQHTSASEGLDKESYQKLQSCISKYSEVLMKKHKFLSIISACSNRSKGFGASWELLPEKCIVLYVQKKSYIPIDEDPFKKYYDDIAVDVREGAFIPFVRTSKERLDPVMMGCEIGGDSYNGQYVRGTLGCFIDHPQFGVCGLTCGHVFLSPNELRELKTTYRGSLKWPLHDMYKNVYQPADQNSPPIGHTVQFICESGSGTKSGMELALFKITDRRPKSADFPEATIISASSVNNIKYDSWRICSTDRLNIKKNQVMKFGSNTEFRNGTLMFDNTAVKYLDNYPLLFGDEVLKLFKQIEVKQNDRAFANLGDSGALVFLAENNCCIGIVEGGTTYGTVVVTPIVPILEELKVHCLKSFESETNLSHIDNQIQSMHGDMQQMKCDLQSVRQDIKNIDTNLQIIAQSLSKNQQ